MKKKIIIILIALIVLVGVSLILIKVFDRKEDSSLTKVRLAEVTHSSFYAPLYVAIENGYFEEEGIDLELILTPGADKVSAAVLSNDVEIGFAGAESAIYVYDQEESNYLRIFSGLTKRDGQFIVARDNYEDFSLEDLYGKEILVGRSTGMPALNFLNGLKNMGIDIDKININYSVEFAALSGSFIGGTGDFVNLFEPNATSLEENGYGHVVASVGVMSGEVPYTAFYARKSYIEENPEIIEGFTKAIAKAITYTLENDATKVAEDIIDQFPDTDVSELALMIDRYKEYDCWLENPFVSEELFTNLEDFLIDFDLLSDYVPYEDLVNNFYEE
ncbi:MAG TPA: ABC transporter substrate-binding protein [Candidatus Onthocola stercoravium]|nr:ABC transporter substrate-binding protein [Candidatus Onthocola stercoravium]